MMKYLAIIGTWLAVLISDSVILPALTDFPSGFGILVFLSALVIVFGVHHWVIGLGIVLAGITELIFGMYFGVVIGAWLVMVWCGYVLYQFLNVKSMGENDSMFSLMPFTLLGLVVFSVGEIVFWLIEYFIYKSGFTLPVLLEVASSPVIISIVIIELAITLFIFRFIYPSQNA